MKPTFFPTLAAWRAWLEKHHQDHKELLVGFYKKDSGKPSINGLSPATARFVLAGSTVSGAELTKLAIASASLPGGLAAFGAPSISSALKNSSSRG